MKQKKPRRGGWSGGSVQRPNYKFMWWCLALGLSAVALATYLMWLP